MASDTVVRTKRQGVTCVALILIAGCTTASPASSAPASSPPTPSTMHTGAVDYRRLEREVVDELNAARTNPRAYSANASALLSLFNGNLLRRPGASAAIRTQEGAAAVGEAVEAMNKQAAVPAVTVSSAIAAAAHDLAADQGRTGNIGHTASDGSSPSDRLSRYGTWHTSYSENVDYGLFATGRDVIVDLLVDDGVPDRGHRRNIFDSSARLVGVSCGPHPRYGSVCVIDQAGGFTARP